MEIELSQFLTSCLAQNILGVYVIIISKAHLCFVLFVYEMDADRTSGFGIQQVFDTNPWAPSQIPTVFLISMGQYIRLPNNICRQRIRIVKFSVQFNGKIDLHALREKTLCMVINNRGQYFPSNKIQDMNVVIWRKFL